MILVLVANLRVVRDKQDDVHEIFDKVFVTQ